MKKILCIIDMQNDFISGALGTPEAESIVENVCNKINSENWEQIYITRDTHYNDLYLETQEGKLLPVPHCIWNTKGWELDKRIETALSKNNKAIYLLKNTFGTTDLSDWIYIPEKSQKEYEVTFVGVCTDICVVSNALILKADCPEMKLVVDASCCAGTTPEKHKAALETMKSCQIYVINED